MVRADVTWTMALADAACYDFLEPVAARAVDAVFERCPEAVALVAGDVRTDMRRLCLARLGVIYERSLVAQAVRMAGLVGSLALGLGGETRSAAMLDIARGVRDEAMADMGASLRARMPLALGYERAVADNFSAAMAEFFDCLLLGRDEVSRVLLDGRPITRLVGFSSSGADPHRHGRMVMCVNTDAGSFFYKPHDCKLDALYLELVGTWFSDCVRAACLVEGEGHAFVERLVPEGLANEAELRTYWHNLGCLTALFHSLGSRDMTHDNLMCCGTRPAVLDLETLLTAEVPFDKEMLAGEASAWGVPADKVASTVICTSILPDPTSRLAVSPLIEDNASGSCLPRVCGEPHTVKGHEKSFLEGFEEGYRRIMRHRKEVLATIARHADATCRQILLNTYAYARSRALLFSPGAMANPVNRDEVLAGLVNSYAAFSPELRRAVAAPDALALAEGDIPYYCSHASARTLYDGDGRAVGDFLSRSALEVASSRIGSFSEEDLCFELDLIRRLLTTDKSSGGKP